MTYTANQQALLAHYVKKILAAPVYELAVRTPLQPAPALSEALGNQILLKREDLQPTFSFKIRGAYNKLVQLSDEQKARGVITASAGNHAQGVALAARELGIAATIVMPATTPELKVLGVRSRGAEAVLHGESFPFALAYALDLAARTGRTFVSPFDDPEVIAGQGTVAMEILRQHPQASTRSLCRWGWWTDRRHRRIRQIPATASAHHRCGVRTLSLPGRSAASR